MRLHAARHPTRLEEQRSRYGASVLHIHAGRGGQSGRGVSTIAAPGTGFDEGRSAGCGAFPPLWLGDRRPSAVLSRTTTSGPFESPPAPGRPPITRGRSLAVSSGLARSLALSFSRVAAARRIPVLIHSSRKS